MLGLHPTYELQLKDKIEAVTLNLQKQSRRETFLYVSTGIQ